MQHGEAPPVEIELVNRMLAGFPMLDVDLAGAIADQVVDHVLEKAEHAVLGYVDALVHAARFDDGGWGRIVFDDWEGARDETLGRARSAVRRFHEEIPLAERSLRIRTV